MSAIRLQAGEVWKTIRFPTPAIALAWVCFQVYLYFEPGTDSLIGRSGHVCFAVALGFNLWADSVQSRAMKFALRLGSVITMVPFIYMALEIDRIRSRTPMLDELLLTEMILAVVLIVSLIAVSLKLVGRGVVLVTVFFLSYQFAGRLMPGILKHRETDPYSFLENQYLTLEGVFGVPTGISVEVVFYFILFAAVFNAYGGGRMIMDLALAATGRHKGGAAKCAILSSGLIGSVSGSAVANVMSTGIFTIPLMRKMGYQPRFAAAVEAIASTGGQIMPPVMGAGVFIMADMLQIPYSDIVLIALLPAVLFFGTLYVVVHLEAGRDGLGGLADAEVPRLRAALAERGHMLIPLGWLALLVVSGYGVTDATMQAVALTVVFGSLRKSTRTTPSELLVALIDSGKRSISVALPCALASVIVSVIAFSGLGPKFTGILIQMAAGQFAVMLVLSMIGSVILGAGMPTTSAYVMSAVLIAPAIVTMGADPLSVHLYIYYFAILSMITPPVALAAYAASTIAETEPGPTSTKAVFLAFPILLIPFTFFTHSSVLYYGFTWMSVFDLLSVVVMVCGASAAVVGWFSSGVSTSERVLLAATAAAIGFSPSIYISGAATLVTVMLLGWNNHKSRLAPVQA